ncbi:hypothetical protein RF11_07110 [Thelohanellus kitauei]|uniref:Uncharacterized protein n=1 Tax=Thelohanellus kitauei TaxID=669202 RepID=A0A0C2J1Q0_THEKT|nr:hypothetical protein RF11_07110 [Thelohanellus kitauei]
MDIGKNYHHFSICLDLQEKLMYVLTLQTPNHLKSLGLFMINKGELECYIMLENDPPRQDEIDFNACRLLDKLDNIYLDETDKTQYCDPFTVKICKSLKIYRIQFEN